MTTVAYRGAGVQRIGGLDFDPLDVTLTPCQSRVFMDRARFRVMVAGRRSGKTVLTVTELLANAFDCPGSLNWFLAPTRNDARDLCWKRLRALPDEYVYSKHEGLLQLVLVNGSEVGMVSAVKSKRGRGVDLCVLDEFAHIDEEVWQEQIRPSLSDRGGRALFTTTPVGHNWAYQLFLRGVTGEDPEWSSHQFTTLEGGLVPQSEVEQARRELDPRAFRQEYEASFESPGGRVYDNFDRREFPAGNVDPSVEDVGGNLYVGMDFNIDPMTCVIAVRARGDECHVLDALELPVSNTEEVARELQDRIRTAGPESRSGIVHGDKRRVLVCPDPSARARRTSAPVGQTDYTILMRAGFQLSAPRAAPIVEDRVNNAQAMLLSADGRRRLRIHPRAKPLIRALDGLTYKEGTNQIDKSAGLDHVTDALGYLLWREFNTFVTGVRIRNPLAAATSRGLA